ncbi:hypothetical protein [Cellulomonas terrae]|uniref:Uncharacterized protein n=1 Tax=Cellulomonas terrae TaxID=311234 RepID=A0A511JFK6_9CELL|nr:hypothetical protein [Cellulomonas terrae]GEL96778.1 hypothetical protein CTE05_03250 [Cellulomonas terrae]
MLRSEPGETSYNAIDPGGITDADGTPWMAFGSFWGGIQLVELAWPSDARGTSPARTSTGPARR